MRGVPTIVLSLAACAASAPKTTPPPAPSPAPPAMAGVAEPGSPTATQIATEPPSRAPAKPDFEPIALGEDQLRRARAVQPHVVAAAAEHGIDANLLNGIIWVESKFDAKARNRHSGARGLMQLMPRTSAAMAETLGRSNRPYDPEFAVHAGAKLLSIMAKRFDGNRDLMLFAYARGGGGARKWQASGEPMPEGVQKFIARVERARATFEALGFPDAGASRVAGARGASISGS